MSRPDLPDELEDIIERTASAALKRLLSELQLASSAGSPFLTVKEACSNLKCSRPTLHRLEEAGVLMPKRFGRKVLYLRADLDAYIQEAGVR